MNSRTLAFSIVATALATVTYAQSIEYPNTVETTVYQVDDSFHHSTELFYTESFGEIGVVRAYPATVSPTNYQTYSIPPQYGAHVEYITPAEFAVPSAGYSAQTAGSGTQTTTSEAYTAPATTHALPAEIYSVPFHMHSTPVYPAFQSQPAICTSSG